MFCIHIILIRLKCNSIYIKDFLFEIKSIIVENDNNNNTIEKFIRFLNFQQNHFIFQHKRFRKLKTFFSYANKSLIHNFL